MRDETRQRSDSDGGSPRDRALAARIELNLQPSPGVDVFDIWVKSVAYIAEASLLEEADRQHFGFEVETTFFHDVNVSRTVVKGRQRNRRTESLIVESGVSGLLLHFFRSGGFTGVLHHRNVTVPAGGLVLIDLAKPFEIVIEACEVMAVIAPRHVLPSALMNLDLHGVVLTAEQPVTRLIATHLEGILRESGELTLDEGFLAVRALLHLVEAALYPHPKTEKTTVGVAEQNVLGRARSYIEANLGNPNLSIADIASGLRMSRMTLYRLFQPEGGARAYIRERRLLRCYEVIISNLRSDLPLGAIAFEQGFTSEALFSRSFKQRFGISPSAARKLAHNQRRGGEGLPPPPPSSSGQPPIGLTGKRR